MKKIVSAFTVILAVASQANAALVVSIVQNGDVAGGNSKATVVLTSNAGVVSAFQGTVNAGGVGFTGTMNQVKAFGALDTPDQSFNPPSPANVDANADTQFKLVPADILAVTAPFETANTAGGVFTYNVTARSAAKDIWQVVAPKGTVITYNFKGAEAIGANSVEAPFQGTFTVGIPEPATASMGALSLLGLGAFRRRKVA